MSSTSSSYSVGSESNDSQASSIMSVSSRKVVDNYVQAWLVDMPMPDMSDPATKPKTPSKLNNLLNKPLEAISEDQIRWLDERTMTTDDFEAARHPASIAPSTAPTPISPSPSSSRSSFTTLSSSCTFADGTPPPPSPTSQPTSSFATPEGRPPADHSTCAPKASRKPRSRNYSQWSMDRLQEEFLQRLQPMSQKRTLDCQFMIDALTAYDADEASSQKKNKRMKKAKL